MYKLEILSRGQFLDYTSDPRREKVYRIETWTFRLLDPESCNDYLASNPLPAESWELDFDRAEAFEAAQQMRIEARQLWDAKVLTLLTGQPVPLGETKGWTIQSLLNDTFAAARVSVVGEQEAIP